MVALGYLLGTIPTAERVGRRVGHDPTLEGSGNPGASNVFRTAGARAGAMVFAGDVVKGMVATGIGLAAGDRMLALACGAAAVVGHVAPGLGINAAHGPPRVLRYLLDRQQLPVCIERGTDVRPCDEQ